MSKAGETNSRAWMVDPVGPLKYDPKTAVFYRPPWMDETPRGFPVIERSRYFAFYAGLGITTAIILFGTIAGATYLWHLLSK